MIKFFISLIVVFIVISIIVSILNKIGEYRSLTEKRPIRGENKQVNSAKLKSRTKDEILISMSRNIGIRPEDVKANFIRELHKKQLTARGTEKAIHMLNESLVTESLQLGLVPESTASALMREWAIEFLENQEYRNRVRTDSEVYDDFKYEHGLHGKSNSEVMETIMSSDELMSLLIRERAGRTTPAERFRLKAIDLMVYEKDYISAIEVIDKGLTINDFDTIPYLYLLKSKCNMELINYQAALDNINKAIQINKQKFPDDFSSIYRFLKRRSEIKELLNDSVGSKQDKELSESFRKKSIETSDNTDDFPF